MKRRSLIKWIAGGSLLAGVVVGLVDFAINHDNWIEKRVKVLIPGQLVRGAWQTPSLMRNIIKREGIRTIVTLTAINSNDSKFVGQEKLVKEMGVRWVIVPMRGSRATPEQMALAADLLAESENQPVFFHCVAGHHRTSLAHAAYLIRHKGMTADQAWDELVKLSWTRPENVVDQNDRFLIEEFARIQRSLSPSREHGVWEIANGTPANSSRPMDLQTDHSHPGGAGGLDRLEPVNAQLRDAATGANLPIGTDDVPSPRSDPS